MEVLNSNSKVNSDIPVYDKSMDDAMKKSFQAIMLECLNDAYSNKMKYGYRAHLHQEAMKELNSFNLSDGTSMAMSNSVESSMQSSMQSFMQSSMQSLGDGGVSLNSSGIQQATVMPVEIA